MFSWWYVGKLHTLALTAFLNMHLFYHSCFSKTSMGTHINWLGELASYVSNVVALWSFYFPHLWWIYFGIFVLLVSPYITVCNGTGYV